MGELCKQIVQPSPGMAGRMDVSCALISTGDAQTIEQIEDEGDQRVQGVASPGQRIMKIELPGAPATEVLKTIAAQYAFADDFPLVDAALFVYIAMGYPVIILFTILASMVVGKDL